MKIAKMMDGTIVQIVRTADQVRFSKKTGWICVCYDFEVQDRRRANFKWVPSDTTFVWVREYIESVTD